MSFFSFLLHNGIKKTWQKSQLYADLRLYLCLVIFATKMVSQISKSYIPTGQTKTISLFSSIKQLFFQNNVWVFSLLMPSIPSPPLPNTDSEMQIHIPSMDLPFLSYTPLEVLRTSLGRTLSNLIKIGTALSEDWTI